MNRHRMNPGADDSLFFEALAYVLEEMSSSDRDAFERRLVEEQNAREAVAEAVRFCQRISEACRTARASVATDKAPAVHVENSWRRPAIWGAAAVAIAASALAMVVVEVARKGAAHSTASAEMEPGKQLAVAWANLPSPAEATDDFDAAQEITTDAFSLESDGTVDDSDAENDATESVEASPAVDWFLEALTASLSREPISDLFNGLKRSSYFFHRVSHRSDPEGVIFHSPGRSPGFTKQSTSVALKGRHTSGALALTRRIRITPFQGYWPTLSRYPGLRPGLWNHAPSGLRRPSAVYLSFQKAGRSRKLAAEETWPC